MKQMFDISEKVISEQSDEIYGVKTINWEDSSWKHLSLICEEQVISLLHTKVYVFSDSVLGLGKMKENPQSNIAWGDRLTWFKSSPEYRALDRIDGEPMEFEWNILLTMWYEMYPSHTYTTCVQSHIPCLQTCHAHLFTHPMCVTTHVGSRSP